MKKKNLHKSFVLLALLASSSLAQAQLLKGYLEPAKAETMQVAYSWSGDVLANEYKELTLAPDGSFVFDMDMPVEHCDVDIYVDNDIYGVHLEKGKTAVIRIRRQADMPAEVSFEGDNADLSRFRNVYSGAFDIMKYFSPDPANSKSAVEYRMILEQEYAAVKKELANIKNPQWRAYYGKLSEGMYTWTKIRIIMDMAYDEGKNLKDYSEYNEAIAKIDPNDEMNIRTNLAVAWLMAQQPEKPGFMGDMTPHDIKSMEIVEREITNPVVREVLTRNMAYNFFSFYAANSDVVKFWSRYKEFAKDYPSLIAAYEPRVDSFLKTKQGRAIPYNPTLISPDGATSKLSDLFGKFIYIDVWATWCGPCCKEIPHLEKVAAHFRGNDNVCIVSISVDENRSAWLKKLENDKPEWKQYVLTREESKAFMEAWGIGGIPRFIMLDKEGKIFAADALRPSDDKLIGTIESQL